MPSSTHPSPSSSAATTTSTRQLALQIQRDGIQLIQGLTHQESTNELIDLLDRELLLSRCSEL
jgi:hypothetical protein